VWEIPIDDRANIVVTKRLRALIGLAVIGASQVANVILAALVAEAGLPRIGQVAILFGGLAINLAVLGTMYRFLTSADPSWGTILPGTVFAAVLFTVLQFAGTALTTRLLASAETYGDFAGVLALLSWLSLHALINLFGAELNAALAGRHGRELVTPTR
jgi:membrane protein